MNEKEAICIQDDNSQIKVSVTTRGAKGAMAMELLDASGNQVAFGFAIPGYDYIGVTYPDGVTEVYTYRTGGASGTIVATVTVVYTTTSKEYILSVTKT